MEIDSKYRENTENRKYNFQELWEIIEILRSQDGCPWDREQTYESMKKYVQNETDEVLEAIDKKDMENLCEEIGDCMMNLLLCVSIAKERGDFTLEDVLTGISRKMLRRHPHVFGDKKVLTSRESLDLWREVKRKEKEAKNKRKS